MSIASKPRALVIVSEDWFARSLLVQAARDTRLFLAVLAVDDGYSALATIWQCVIEGWRPDAILLDRHAPMPSAPGLVASLRTDPDTSDMAIAVLGPADEYPAPATPAARLDVFSTCDAQSPELPWIYQAIAAKLEARGPAPTFPVAHPRAAFPHSRLWRPAW